MRDFDDDRAVFASLLPVEAAGIPVNDPETGVTIRPASTVELRRWGRPITFLEFQRELIAGIGEQTTQRNVCGLLSLPTGAGKTITTSRIVLDALAGLTHKSPTCLWLAPQRELLFQASNALQAAWWSGAGPASLDVRILERSDSYKPLMRPTCWLMTPMMAKNLCLALSGNTDVAIFDEAHHGAAQMFGDVWNHIVSPESEPPLLSLGMSATPTREDPAEASVLQEAFGSTLFLPRSLGRQPVSALMDREVLSRPVFMPITGVPRFSLHRGFSDKRPLRSFVVDPDRWRAVIDCIVTQETGQIVTYALTRSHGIALTRHLRCLGVSAEYLDGETPFKNRFGIMERFRNQDTRVLINVALLLEGVDCPAADSVLLTYPVGSQIRLRQMIGRVLRGPAVGGTASCRVWAIDGSQQWLDNTIHGSDFLDEGWRIRQFGHAT